jgi:hypothetical protein
MPHLKGMKVYKLQSAKRTPYWFGCQNWRLQTQKWKRFFAFKINQREIGDLSKGSISFNDHNNCTKSI